MRKYFITPSGKKIVSFFLLLIYGTIEVLAQQSAISSGGSATGLGGSASYSIGEVSYITAFGSGAGTGYLSTQGLQQACPFIIVSVTAGSATNFCQGNSVTLKSNSVSSNQWYKDGVVISGATSTTLNVTNSGSYTVKGPASICQSGASNAVKVIVSPVPATPSITQNGNQLTSSVVSGNQWYLNNTIISGATAQNYTPVASGNYTVQVTINNCPSAFSSALGFIVTAIPNINTSGNQIKVFPNPVNGQLIITNSSNTFSVLNIRLVDIYGKQLTTLKSSASRIELDMTRYAAGLYIIWIEDKKDKILGKKVIVKITE